MLPQLTILSETNAQLQDEQRQTNLFEGISIDWTEVLEVSQTMWRNELHDCTPQALFLVK